MPFKRNFKAKWQKKSDATKENEKTSDEELDSEATKENKKTSDEELDSDKEAKGRTSRKTLKRGLHRNSAEQPLQVDHLPNEDDVEIIPTFVRDATDLTNSNAHVPTGTITGTIPVSHTDLLSSLGAQKTVTVHTDALSPLGVQKTVTLSHTAKGGQETVTVSHTAMGGQKTVPVSHTDALSPLGGQKTVTLSHNTDMLSPLAAVGAPLTAALAPLDVKETKSVS